MCSLSYKALGALYQMYNYKTHIFDNKLDHFDKQSLKVESGEMLHFLLCPLSNHCGFQGDTFQMFY